MWERPKAAFHGRLPDETGGFTALSLLIARAGRLMTHGSLLVNAVWGHVG